MRFSRAITGTALLLKHTPRLYHHAAMMRHVEWPSEFHYVGADIVHDLILNNRHKYPETEFMELTCSPTRYLPLIAGSRGTS